MIPSLLALLLPVALAQATAESEEEPVPDETLSDYRLPLSMLVERTIGVTSKPVEFNWRDSPIQVAVTGDHLYELNNFNSLRAGGMVRLPRQGLIYEIGVSYAWVWDTPSSELLALTPYRQPGRPQRIEADFMVGIPLAEGVVTAAPRLFPSVELVFNAYAGLHYNFYPMSFDGLKAREVGAALVSPTLSEAEIENLEDRRLDAMQIDPGRYGVVLGIGNDIYLKGGVFLSPRVRFGVPLLAPVSETQILFWADMALAIGVAF